MTTLSDPQKPAKYDSTPPLR